MTAEEIFQMIEQVRLPFAYHHFAEGETPDLPYLIYTYPGSIPYAADDQVFVQGMQLQIELYSEKRDLSIEHQIETVLDGSGLVYWKSEVYIESEKLYEIIYETEVAVMG